MVSAKAVVPPMLQQKVTKRDVIERLWAELDRVNHQAQFAAHAHSRYVDGKYVTVKADARSCNRCRRTVRAVETALKGLHFTEAVPNHLRD